MTHLIDAETDPRAADFNYGIGWGNAPKPPIYDEAEALAHRMRNEVNEKSRHAWALDMATRNVRLACTGIEKANAVAALTREMEKQRGRLAA